MSNDSKVIPFPVRSDISYKQRMINQLGKGYLPCFVSDRWLQFNTVSEMYGDFELVTMNVMTLNKDGQPHKLCEMIIEKEDLIRVYKAIEKIEE